MECLGKDGAGTSKNGKDNPKGEPNKSNSKEAKLEKKKKERNV